MDVHFLFPYMHNHLSLAMRSWDVKRCNVWKLHGESLQKKGRVIEFIAHVLQLANIDRSELKAESLENEQT